MRRYDFLIVGAGLFGATFAYLAKKAGKKCLVIDKRPFAGGNIYCEVVDGIAVHKYGAHIFHTSDRVVWEFVNRFVSFNNYINSPIANYKGKLYNLPFNMNTFYQLWGVITPEEAKEKLDEQRLRVLSRMEAEGIKEPRNLEEQALALVGDDIYDKLIKGYTEKQWGRKCSDLPAFIIRRLPLRLEFDNNYFNDRYQGIPDCEDGYNTLISGLTKDIDMRLNCDFFQKPVDKWLQEADRIIYTGPIDKLFDFEFGALAYRSVRFETEILDVSNYQGNAVVNYTDSKTPYTRIIEHKHFNTFGEDIYANPRTVISREYSAEWTPDTEPFYPVNDNINNSLYERYVVKAKTMPNIYIAGRLGQYKYLDMDKTIAEAMCMAKKIL